MAPPPASLLFMVAVLPEMVPPVILMVPPVVEKNAPPFLAVLFLMVPPYILKVPPVVFGMFALNFRKMAPP